MSLTLSCLRKTIHYFFNNMYSSVVLVMIVQAYNSRYDTGSGKHAVHYLSQSKRPCFAYFSKKMSDLLCFFSLIWKYMGHNCFLKELLDHMLIKVQPDNSSTVIQKKIVFFFLGNGSHLVVIELLLMVIYAFMNMSVITYAYY